MRHLRYVLVALAIGALAAGPLPSAAAQTAPTYQSSDPAKDEMLDHPPSQVTVTFDQPLDQSSWMNVLDACGKEIDAGPPTVDLNELTVEIGDKTPSGNWKVVYKAVGIAGATGSSGSSFEFMVHHGSPCKGKPKHHHPPGGGKKDDDEHNHDDKDRDRQGHDGHDVDETSDHSRHSDMPGTSGSSHSGHTTGSDTPGHGGAHGKGHGNHDGGPREKTPPPEGTGTTLATGGTGNVPIGADGEAVLLGLGLALAVGVLGGWLLRLSSSLSGA